MIALMSFSACSKNDNDDVSLNNEDISSKYEDIAGNSLSDKPIDSGASVLGAGFSLVDFTFTSADDTVAFSLDNNSFAKMTIGGTFYNYITPGNQVVTYNAGYKTARGMSLANTAQEFLKKYNIADGNALYIKNGESIYYNPAGLVFSGKLTVLFASKDSVSYEILTSKDVQKFLSVRDAQDNKTYMDPSKITSLFADYNSIVSMDITADQDGNVSEFSMYKFDK